MKEFKPNVVLSDSRASPIFAARLLHIPVVLILNQFRVEIIRRPSNKKLTLFERFFFRIANLGWMFPRTAIGIVWGMSQAILIPDLPNPFTISTSNLAIPKSYVDKIRLIGPIIGTTSNEVARTRTKHSRPRIYAAISGPRREREVLGKILEESLHHLSSKYNIVLSRGNPKGTLKPHRVHGIRVYDWIRNQDEWMKKCDIIVARAGHGTIMKSLTYGKPMVLIPIPDHTEQMGNAKRAESMHVARVIQQNNLNPTTLDASLQTVLNGRYLKHAEAISKSVSSLNAVSIACDVIESLTA